MNETVITIGGQAGQGLVTVSDILLKLLSRTGHKVFATQDYMSRVRGGHNFMQIRVGGSQPLAKTEKSHLLAAFDKRTVEEHIGDLSKPAIILHDTDEFKPEGKGNYAGVPLAKIAVGEGNRIYENSVLLGAMTAILGLDIGNLKKLLEERFEKLGAEAVGKNVSAARKGFEYVTANYPGLKAPLPPPENKRLMLINGAEAIGLGMIAGGVRFISAYPMSPSTSIFNYVTKNGSRLGIVSEQAEDEIAAINMALGASAAGARAVTTTSGGGLDLMAEGISLAGISEAPVVIANIQRPGPATGLPTRTGQEDLDLVLNIGHGEFPRFVFAPGTAEEAYYTAVHSMNLADKYQVPVFILGDQTLVDSYVTVEGLDLDRVKKENHLADPGKVDMPYQRYKLTPTGISPRLPYGTPNVRVMSDCHLHEESGHITEDPIISKKMVQKRFNKVPLMEKEPFHPVRYPLVRHGKGKAGITLVCWGSSYGAVKEAVDILNADGANAEMVHFNRLAPFPAKETAALLEHRGKVHAVEGNFRSQLGMLIARETGIKTAEPVLRYDGRPFTAEYIIDNLKKEKGNGIPLSRRKGVVPRVRRLRNTVVR